MHKRDTASLEKLQSAKDLKDYEGKSLTMSTIVTMDLVTVKPPKYDYEIFADVSSNKGIIPVITKFNQVEILDGESDRTESPRSDCLDFDGDGFEIADDYFLCLGMSKGNVIFVRVDNLEYIYSRFLLHR